MLDVHSFLMSTSLTSLAYDLNMLYFIIKLKLCNFEINYAISFMIMVLYCCDLLVVFTNCSRDVAAERKCILLSLAVYSLTYIASSFYAHSSHEF